MQKINIGEPQPLKCPKCDAMRGYKYSDRLSLWYTSYHTPAGNYEGGAYSDSVNVLHKGVTAICLDCNTKLPFVLTRKSGEITEVLNNQ